MSLIKVSGVYNSKLAKVEEMNKAALMFIKIKFCFSNDTVDGINDIKFMISISDRGVAIAAQNVNIWL